jgi:hypothetical protein
MSIERNDLVFFDLDEKDSNHPAFKALEGVSLGDVRFPFGFFRTPLAKCAKKIEGMAWVC